MVDLMAEINIFWELVGIANVLLFRRQQTPVSKQLKM